MNCGKAVNPAWPVNFRLIYFKTIQRKILEPFSAFYLVNCFIRFGFGRKNTNQFCFFMRSGTICQVMRMP